MTEEQRTNKESSVRNQYSAVSDISDPFISNRRFSTSNFSVTMNFRICTWKDEMSLHAFVMARSKVLWACKMPHFVHNRAWDAKVSWTHGSDFLRHSYSLPSCCLEELYRLLVAKLQPLPTPCHLSCFDL